MKMLKDESNTQKMTSLSNNSNIKMSTTQNDLQQNLKDRTLFCINIDQKCTEDILYELFLQAGPIDNIVRKADRNGNLICLITYKHIESCEYAIKIFNGISLFNQSLKVRLSDSNSTVSRESNQNNRLSIQTNNYHRAYNNRQNSNDNQKIISQPTTPQSLMPPPQQQLAHLIGQVFSHNIFSPQIPEFGTNPFQQQLNRSWSGTNINENDYHQSRRNSNNFDYNRGSSNNWRNDNCNNSRSGGINDARDYLKQNKQPDSRSRDRRAECNDRSRSRSPIRKRNRR